MILELLQTEDLSPLLVEEYTREGGWPGFRCNHGRATNFLPAPVLSYIGSI